MMITLTHRTLTVSASDCSLDSPDDGMGRVSASDYSLDSPDDGMGNGSSHDALEPKEVAFSTEATKGRNLLKSEVTRTIK